MRTRKLNTLLIGTCARQWHILIVNKFAEIALNVDAVIKVELYVLALPRVGAAVLQQHLRHVVVDEEVLVALLEVVAREEVGGPARKGVAEGVQVADQAVFAERAQNVEVNGAQSHACEKQRRGWRHGWNSKCRALFAG